MRIVTYTHTCTDGYYNADNGVAVASATMTCSACGAGYYLPANYDDTINP